MTAREHSEQFSDEDLKRYFRKLSWMKEKGLTVLHLNIEEFKALLVRMSAAEGFIRTVSHAGLLHFSGIDLAFNDWRKAAGK